ncbi:hypothetical protein DSECCO2_538190 [anaerobic digester metagenome]
MVIINDSNFLVGVRNFPKVYPAFNPVNEPVYLVVYRNRSLGPGFGIYFSGSHYYRVNSSPKFLQIEFHHFIRGKRPAASFIPGPVHVIVNYAVDYRHIKPLGIKLVSKVRKRDDSVYKYLVTLLEEISRGKVIRPVSSNNIVFSGFQFRNQSVNGLNLEGEITLVHGNSNRGLCRIVNMSSVTPVRVPGEVCIKGIGEVTCHVCMVDSPFRKCVWVLVQEVSSAAAVTGYAE